MITCERKEDALSSAASQEVTGSQDGRGNNPGGDPATATGDQFTITLIAKAQADLDRLQERTSLSRTDIANRAISLYEFFDAQMRAGHEMIDRDTATGEIQRVHILNDAPAGHVTSARPASQRPGRAGRHRRLFPTPAGQSGSCRIPA